MTSARAQFALGTSFVIISALGVSVIVLAPANAYAPSVLVRSTLFVIIMACVHATGYILYSRQQMDDAAESISQVKNLEPSSSYESAFRSGICVDFVLGFLFALMLDGGRAFSFFLVAMLAHWFGMLLILWRRHSSPTEFDLSFNRIGILPLLIVTGFVAPFVWKLIGDSDLNGLQRLLHH